MRRLVRDLELEARDRSQRRDQDNRDRRDGSVGNRCWGGGGNPTNPAHIHARIVHVHKNHADTEITLIPKNHVDARTILILENRVDVKTVHVRTGMLIEVRIP